MQPASACLLCRRASRHTQRRFTQGAKAALLRENKWEPAEIITAGFMDGDPAVCKRVQKSAIQWIGPKMANLTLRFVSNGTPDVRIRFQQGHGSWSYIGTLCKDVPTGEPTMNFGWLDSSSDDATLSSVVLHEFGHAFGLIHEHQNPTHPIRWDRSAVIAVLSQPPNNWDESTIQRNIFDRYDPDKVQSTPVDAKSIMMYPIPASWTLDGFSTGLNREAV